jgi:hypothetical protein
MQGQRDLQTVSRLIMSELTPTVSAQHGAFFLAEGADESAVTPGKRQRRLLRRGLPLRLIASYGYQKRKGLSNVFHPGEASSGRRRSRSSPSSSRRRRATTSASRPGSATRRR